MKKILFTLALLVSFSSFGQELLKEITKTFDNGKPMFIDFLDMEDLKKVKTDAFNEEGEKIFSLGFDKKTGLPDGEFFDLINKGYYNKGVLTCYDCMLVGANIPSVLSYNYNYQNTSITKGDVVNGRFNGSIEDYDYYEKNYKTGIFEKSTPQFTAYNNKGEIEGEYNLRSKFGEIKLNLKSGIIRSYVLKDFKGIVIDSLSNDNKIWKINYKFRKNDGLVIFNNYKNISGPREVGDEYWKNDVYSYDFIISTNFQSSANPIIPIGGVVAKIGEIERGGDRFYAVSNFNTGGSPTILDNNGIYSIYNNEQQAEFSPFYLDTYKLYSDSMSMENRSETNRETNLFTIVYNYIINNDQNIFKTKLGNGDEGTGILGSLFEFREVLLSKTYRRYLTKNMTAGHDQPVPWYSGLYSEVEGRYPSEKIRNYYLSTIFEKVIDISDYVRASSDLFNSTNYQELFVWNYQSKKYDKVDFDKLIEITTKVDFDKLELLYSSEKSSMFYKKFYKTRVRMSKITGYKVSKIELHRLPGNNDEDKAFTFYYFTDLNDLKKYKKGFPLSIKQQKMRLIHKDEKKLLLVYGPKYIFSK